LNCGYQVRIHARFVDKSQSALRHAGCYEFLVRVHGQENDFGERTSLADSMNRVDSVQPGQADVGHDDIGFKPKSLCNQRRSVRRSSQYVTGGLKEGDFCIGEARVVICY